MSLPTRPSLEGVLLLLGLAVGWGINWPIMKFIIGEIPPLSFRAFCLLFGGLGILSLARLSGLSIRLPKAFLHKIFWVCLLNIVGWNVMATYGLSLLPAGRSALLGYTMPIWTVLLSVWVLQEKFTQRIAIALLLGMAGIFSLLSDSLIAWFGGPANLDFFIGALLMVLAAWSWAAGSVLMKRWLIPVHTAVLTGWLLLLASLPLIPAALIVDGLPTSAPSSAALWGLAYNVLIAFMFCYWAWVRLVELLPVGVTSLSSLLTPLIGVVSGAYFLGEDPGWPELNATLLILAAIAVVNFGKRKAKPAQTQVKADPVV